MNAQIVEPLKGLAIPVSSIVHDPDNARLHDERNLETIRRSFKRFGQRIPIVVREDGMTVSAGNGRLTVALEMGWDHIAAVVLDDTKAEAAAFALADNRSAELAEWDWPQLAETLSELGAELPDFDVQDLGWSEEELEGMSMAAAWDDLEAERAAAAGDRTRVDRNTLVLRFTQEEADKLEATARSAGMEGEVTSEVVLKLLALAPA